MWGEAVGLFRRIAIAALMLILCAIMLVVKVSFGTVIVALESLDELLDMFFDVVFGPEGRK